MTASTSSRDKPPRSRVYPAKVPPELRAAQRWVTWCYTRDDKGWTKRPFIAGNGHLAKSNDPTTWREFTEALRDYETNLTTDGIGCMFTGGEWCGIDLDHCLDGDRIKPWALPFLLPSYTEITPSGAGLRVIVRGRWPGRRRQYPQPDGGKVEIYDADSPRYFTVTGQLWNEDHPAINELQDALERLARLLEPPPSPQTIPTRPAPPADLADADLLRKARAARNGADFVALYDRGDLSGYNGDSSRADLALCGRLAFWTNGDVNRIDALFRQSALMRPKWDQVHSADGRTYGQMTIDKALSGKTEFYQPSSRPLAPSIPEPEWPADLPGELPAAPRSAAESESQPDAPELPDDARLAYAAGSGAGAWLDRYTAQARAVSPMTPLEFHESAALWLAGVAIARRLVLPLPFGDVYPNLFVLWLAPTTLYRKSTALNFARDLARRAFPHLLTPQDTTPEAFLSDLAGAQPTNFASLSPAAAARWEQGRKFAAQKGLCLDELSGLLAGAGKDYNAGLLEALLRLYDCDPDFTRSTRNAGWLTVRNGYLSLLGASTPAALSPHLQAERLWSNGFWPRFAILTPAGRPAWATAQALDNPPDLAADLRRLADRLPAGAVDNPPAARPVTLGGGVYDAWERYSKALSYDLLTPDLDARLYGTYGRLPVLALKVAVILAALDWPSARETPQVELPHLARALFIAEAWRASAHRARWAATQDENDRLEHRVLYQIERAEPHGATMRELSKAIRDKRPSEIEAALHELITGGGVEVVRQSGGQQGGRPTDRYRLFRG